MANLFSRKRTNKRREVVRWLNKGTGNKFALRTDGVILMLVGKRWVSWKQLRADISIATYVEELEKNLCFEILPFRRAA